MRMAFTFTLLGWKLMTKNESTESKNPGKFTELSYDEWLGLHEDELYIEFMETGAYYEMDEEDWLEKKYEEYENSQLKDTIRSYG
jgi:hypothetical protein|tara:strand:- start:16 stop:270 length:255 start_codon:yes stop_codon:yes gene_type:complete